MVAIALCFFLAGFALTGLYRPPLPDVPPGHRPASAVEPPPPSTGTRLLPLPGEFERQAALMIGTTQLIYTAPQVYVDIVSAVHRHVCVISLVSGQAEIAEAKRLLTQARVSPAAVRFIGIRLNSAWARDYGPLFSRRADGSVVVLDLEYSGRRETGERATDAQVARKFARLVGARWLPMPLGIPGGNLLSNGDGLYVSTVAAAMPSRSRTKTPQTASAGSGKAQARLDALTARLGGQQWLALEPLRDEPSQDIDMFLTFVARDVAVVGRLDPAREPANAAILDRAAARLAAVRTSRGPMKVHRIPMPPPRNGSWRSYNNVVFANGVLLMPKFSDDDPTLRHTALALYAQLLPGWQIVGIRSDKLEQVDGYLHCLTRNVPWFVPPPRLPETAAPSSRAAPTEPVARREGGPR